MKLEGKSCITLADLASNMCARKNGALVFSVLHRTHKFQVPRAKHPTPSHAILNFICNVLAWPSHFVFKTLKKEAGFYLGNEGTQIAWTVSILESAMQFTAWDFWSTSGSIRSRCYNPFLMTRIWYLISSTDMRSRVYTCHQFIIKASQFSREQWGYCLFTGWFSAARTLGNEII